MGGRLDMDDVADTLDKPARLAALLDLPFALDDDGAALVPIEAVLDVTIDRSTDGREILLVAPLGGRLAGPAGLRAARALLDWNPRLAAAGTGAYAREPTDGEALLVGRKPVAWLDPERFRAWFEDFAEAALVGRDIVAPIRETVATEENEPPPGILHHADLADEAGIALIGLA